VVVSSQDYLKQLQNKTWFLLQLATM
jgi:hypothetical protein